MHPDRIRKANVEKVNHNQRTPHESKEVERDTEEFLLLSSIMDELMAFIQTNVCRGSFTCCPTSDWMIQLQYQLPDIYDELSLYCKILPLNAHSPAFPFSGVVVNICVSTAAHRDVSDQRICIVIPFGQWEGGELCLYELGLVVKLQAGDVLVFPSCDITHFNLHFTGKRGSLVLHSDRQGKRWVKNYNGWQRYIAHTK